MMRWSGRRTPGGGCCSPKTAACYAAASCGRARTCGARPDEQLADVLDRFAPPLAPWTRCPACNGPLSPAPKAAIDPVLQPGTRRTYWTFARCADCTQVYWRGAHSKHLEQISDSAVRAVRTATSK